MRGGWVLECSKGGKVATKSASTFYEAVRKKNLLLKKHEYDTIILRERKERQPRDTKNSINELRVACGLERI